MLAPAKFYEWYEGNRQLLDVTQEFNFGIRLLTYSDLILMFVFIVKVHQKHSSED